ncbi:hypothetical protein JCM8547_004458 [Rhodosporidiobolus lusitaniae]
MSGVTIETVQIAPVPPLVFPLLLAATSASPVVDVDSTWQANFVSDRPPKSWCTGMGLFVRTMALIWFALWFVLRAAIKGTYKINGKRVEGSQIVVHSLSRVFIWLPHAKKGEDGRKDWESNRRFTNKNYLSKWRFGMLIFDQPFGYHSELCTDAIHAVVADINAVAQQFFEYCFNRNSLAPL